MIKISKQTDYALQLLIELSKIRKNELLGLKKFSNKSSISFLFLQKIAKLLREAKIVESVKGKDGGYRLNKPSGKINIMTVMEAVEGPYGATECSRADGCCGKAGQCNVKKGMEKINKKIISLLKKTTIKSFVK